MLAPEPEHSSSPLCLTTPILQISAEALLPQGRFPDQWTPTNPCATDMQRAMSFYFRALCRVVEVSYRLYPLTNLQAHQTGLAFVYLPTQAISPQNIFMGSLIIPILQKRRGGGKQRLKEVIYFVQCHIAPNR